MFTYPPSYSLALLGLPAFCGIAAAFFLWQLLLFRPRENALLPDTFPLAVAGAFAVLALLFAPFGAVTTEGAYFAALAWPFLGGSLAAWAVRFLRWSMGCKRRGESWRAAVTGSVLWNSKRFRVFLVLLALATAGYTACYFSTPWIAGPSADYTPVTQEYQVWTEQAVYPPDVDKIVYYAKNVSTEIHECMGRTLQICENGQWYTLNQRDHAVTSELWCIEPGETESYAIYPYLYGPRLRPGRYRIVWTAKFYTPEQCYTFTEFEVR